MPTPQPSELTGSAFNNELSAALPSSLSSTTPMNNDSEEEECAICYDTLDDPNKPSMIYHYPERVNVNNIPGVTTPLEGHAFHVECMVRYRDSKITDPELREKGRHINIKVDCPMCRSPILSPVALYKEGHRRFVVLLENETMQNGAWTAQTAEQKEEMNEIIRLWKLSASEKHSNALYLLGRVYSFGTGVIPDLNYAISCYIKAGEQGSHDAYFSIGNLFFGGVGGVAPDFKEAEKWFLQASEAGSNKAMNNLGTMYYNGSLGEVNYSKAFELYLKSAELGNAQAQFKLGNMYYKAISVDKNPKEAFSWYEKSAKQKLPQALFMVGSFLLNGSHGEKDFIKARQAFEESAQLGFVVSEYKLGDIYFYGNGVDKDEKKALSYYKLAASKNYSNAQVMLGLMNMNGQGGLVKDDIGPVSWT